MSRLSVRFSPVNGYDIPGLESWLERQAGRVLPVLFEEEKGGLWQGHAPGYALVRAQGENLHNRLLEVKITGVEGSALTGTVMGG